MFLDIYYCWDKKAFISLWSKCSHLSYETAASWRNFIKSRRWPSFIRMETKSPPRTSSLESGVLNMAFPEPHQNFRHLQFQLRIIIHTSLFLRPLFTLLVFAYMIWFLCLWQTWIGVYVFCVWRSCLKLSIRIRHVCHYLSFGYAVPSVI